MVRVPTMPTTAFTVVTESRGEQRRKAVDCGVPREIRHHHGDAQ